MQATVQEGSAAHERMRHEEEELGAKHSAEMERINQKYGGSLRRYSVYLLFWYKITQFTCFPGTKVQILMLRSPLPSVNRKRASSGSEKLQFTCFTGKKKIQILTLSLSAQRQAQACLFWKRKTPQKGQEDG
jgi:hypothetical protein